LTVERGGNYTDDMNADFHNGSILKVLLPVILLSILVSRRPSSNGQETSPTRKHLTIVYSSNTNGIIRSCRCPGNLFGSLPQRAKVIKDIRGNGKPVLLVDAGDLFPNKDDKLKAEYVLRCYAVMDYDAIGIGEREFACGAVYLGRMIEESELPFTSANLVVRDDGEPIASPHIIREIDGCKIGIVSVVSPKMFFRPLADQRSMYSAMSDDGVIG
jgi:2',3'-cyclic-nucleotide 2'-phosphodiesterase (5'-nucleotidase family)